METKFKFMKIRPFALVLLMFLSLNGFAQKERLQTAFIYQLTRLIEWCPEGKQGNFVIGVLGNDPALVTELNALQSRRVGTQQIEVKTFATVADVSQCNILFVPDNQFGNINAVNAKVKGFCTLILSDRVGSANQGAGVSIVFNEAHSKLEFEIHRNFMQRNSFSVNDQLYSLATKVY